MGMFDSFVGWVECPTCNQLTQGEVQFKWLDCTLETYSVGDFVGGTDVFGILERDELPCPRCKEMFQVYVLGKEGYVYGWCNDVQLKVILPSIPESTSEPITFQISKEFLESNMEAVIQSLTEAYTKNPLQTHHVLTGKSLNETQIASHVCRIPYSVEHPYNRLKVGDGCYYDNRTNPYSPWRLKDKLYTITDRVLDDATQLYVYTIAFGDKEVIRNVKETEAVTVFQRDKIIKQILENKQDVTRYYELKNKERNEDEEREYTFLSFCLFHLDRYTELIEDMLASGEIRENS